VNSQGKIKENFSSSECPIFGKRPYYCLYSLVEGNRGEYVCKLTPRISDLMPSRPPLSFLYSSPITGVFLFKKYGRQTCILKVKRKGVCTTFVNAVILSINLRRHAVIAGPADGSASSSSSVLLQN